MALWRRGPGEAPAVVLDMWVQDADSLSPAVLALFDEELRRGLDPRVADADEMFRVFYWGHGEDRDQALAMYLASGKAIWAAARAALEWHFGGLDRISRLLDFASGYGRVTRHIVTDLASDRIVVSDIQPEAMRIQAEQFGVTAVVSTTNPAELDLEGPFDAILVSSLFTHLPQETFRSWLARLGSLLSEQGVLLLSVHDTSLLGAEGAETDFVFRPESESDRLNGSDYGSAWASEAFVRAAVAKDLGEHAITRLPRGFANLQDLYVISRRPGVSSAPLELPILLDGFVESCELAGASSLQLSGWLTDRLLRERPRELRLFIEGRLVTQVPGDQLPERGDVGHLFGEGSLGAWGYAVEADLGRRWRPEREVRLTAARADGSEAVLFCRSVQAGLLYSARIARRILEREREAWSRQKSAFEHARSEVTALAARIEQQQAVGSALEARLAAMEASRAWRLARHWFALRDRVRRLLGRARPASHPASKPP